MIKVKQIADILVNEIDFIVFFRLVLAMSCGVLIGQDRSKRGSPAGVKTHSLVAIGSALVVLLAEYTLRFGGTDITRMPAQVISGIGFLGAGTILVTGDRRIQGLTSAASIWFTGCVGLAAGAGFYTGVFSAVILEIFVFKILKRFSGKTPNTVLQDIYIQYDQTLQFVDIIRVLKESHCEIIAVDNKKFSGHQFDESFHKISVLTLQLEKEQDLEKVVQNVSQISGAEVVGVL